MANVGWRWLFHIFIIIAGVQIVLMFLFCPETTYHRDRIYDIDQWDKEEFDKLVERKRIVTTDEEFGAGRHSKIEDPSAHPVQIPAPATFLQELKPWSKIYSKDNFILLSIAPFVVCLNIGAFYTIFASGIMVTWIVAFSLILAQEFSPPPYLFNAAQVGYLSTGPAVGGALGCLFMAAFTDPMVRYFSKKKTMEDSSIPPPHDY